MTFVFGTNTELLYSMPATGASITATTKQIISGTSATNPPFQAPALQNIWSVAQMPGKALHFSASGGFDISANTNTMWLYADSAFSSATTALAQTGAATWAASAVGFWQLIMDMTCVSCGNSVSTWYTGGNITVGPGSAPTAFGSTITFANAVNAGVPQTISLNPATPYYFELYTQWGGAPTAFVCTQFEIYGQN
jgi:hypothetical protein